MITEHVIFVFSQLKYLVALMRASVRKAAASELQTIQALVVSAFGDPEGPEIADLVGNLLSDHSAHPLLSLVATEDAEVTGYILFTHVEIEPSDKKNNAAILAPLAVLPEFQSLGIGGQLIEKGLDHLAGEGVDLVFVLGHPGYYTKFGFTPAGKLGFEAPYSIPSEHADAWMVRATQSSSISGVGGKVLCADSLNKPEYWQE